MDEPCDDDWLELPAPASAMQGHILAGLLQAQGIQARLDGAELAHLQGVVSPLAPVQLRVQRWQIDRARRVLADWARGVYAVGDDAAAPAG